MPRIIAVLLLLAAPAAAQTTCIYLGNGITHCTGPSGQIVTCIQVGAVVHCS